MLTIFEPARVSAVPSFIQGIGTTSVTSVSLAGTATAGDLLVVICGDNTTSTITGPSGYTQIINESGTVSQAIFYKFAAGTEKNGIGCTFTGSGTEGVQVLEYSGIHTYATVEGSTSASGSSTTVNTGTLTTAHASDLLIAAAISNGQNQVSWNGPFTTRTHDELTKGSPGSRDAISAGDQTVVTSGSYSASASAANAAWRGQIVAFRALAPAQTITADFVDGSGNSVASPAASLSSTSVGFTCQTATGSLGTASQKVRVSSTLDKGTWNLTMAATSGPTATWYAPPAGPIPAHTYKFNDPAGSGCTNGQLTVNAAAGTLTPQTNCTTAGLGQGPSTAFGGSNNSITILTGSPPSNVDCYWDLTGISLSQKIPAGQAGGDYTINMTMTATST